MDNLQKHLIEKEYQKRLGHFYLLEGPQRLSAGQTKQWAVELLINIFKNHGINLSPEQLDGHNDIYIIETEAKSYVKDDFKELTRRLKNRSDILPYKFVVINEAHKLSEKVSNMLLKTLEEPQVSACIMLMNNLKSSFLATVESRAIKLLIPLREPDEEGLEKFSSAMELQKKLKQDPQLELRIQRKIFKCLETQDLDSKQIQQIDSYLKAYELDLEYNNGSLTRCHQLISLMSFFSEFD